jgi:hypothetical protein
VPLRRSLLAAADHQQIREGRARARILRGDAQAVSPQQLRPPVVRAEGETLPPVAGGERLQPVPRPHAEEAEAAGGVSFADDDHPARLERRRDARQQGFLLLRRQQVEDVEQEHRAGGWQVGVHRVSLPDLRGIAEREAGDAGAAAPQLNADDPVEARQVG